MGRPYKHMFIDGVHNKPAGRKTEFFWLVLVIIQTGGNVRLVWINRLFQARLDRFRRSADFPVCCIAGFPTCVPLADPTRQSFLRHADWETLPRSTWSAIRRVGKPALRANARTSAVHNPVRIWEPLTCFHENLNDLNARRFWSCTQTGAGRCKILEEP